MAHRPQPHQSYDGYPFFHGCKDSDFKNIFAKSVKLASKIIRARHCQYVDKKMNIILPFYYVILRKITIFAPELNSHDVA